MAGMQSGMNPGANREYIRSKLVQGKDALQEAYTIFEEGAALGFVVSNLYFAFLYPVLGLLKAQGASVSTQSIALSLFEREFIEKGVFERRFLDGFRRSFDLRPACACEEPKIISNKDVEELLPIARDFLVAVEKLIG